MSWIYGVCGKNIEDEFQKIKSFSGNYKIVNNENIKFIYGGIDDTTFVDNKEDNISVILGIPFINKNNKILKAKNVFEFTNSDYVDGHYLYLSHSPISTIIINDSLGLRDLFYVVENNKLFFSSRLDLLTSFNGSKEIDFNGFSSAWKTMNQISLSSGIKNISRLGPGGKLEFKNDKLTVETEHWKPNLIGDISDKSIVESFEKVLNSEFDGNKKISLGLSGGLDSRFLLAILNSSNQNKFYTHTFYDEDSPDSIVSDQIAHRLKLNHEKIFFKERNTDEIIKNLFEYISFIGVNSTAVESLHFSLHKNVYQKNNIIVDGGFGEIFRRQFLNTLALQEKNKFDINDPKKMLGFMQHHKADIFSKEVNDVMMQNVFDEITNVVSEMPSVKEYGFKNWIDLLLLRTRLPNLYGAGQSVLDNNVLAFMPFAQKKILNLIFNLSVSERENSKFIKRVIKNRANKLSKISLVKNQTTYPFGMNKLLSHGYTLVKRKFGNTYQDPKEKLFFEMLKEFVFDTFDSADVKNHSLYDSMKVKAIINDYYNNDNRSSYQLNWLLTFEVWRQSMNIR